MMVSDTAEVTVGLPAEGAVTFKLPLVEPHGSARVPLSIHAHGLAVSATLEMEAWSGGLPRLAEFFDDLAAGWRGWAEVKDFRDDGGNVSMSATHDGRGLVLLNLSARNHPSPGSWLMEIGIPIEPGSLESLAQRIRVLTRPIE